ncbi:hypothetical protein ATN84_25630 [Paramesorhizobium deserti]|uniref:Uncharacterized protein n=1 Tax=Paramesorhizobium deserti TaxID=1494590 RepID=A0A135HV82_9HYPH|nr:hypothetical protein ATN84_25630 [Paramesorhizobium deserti]
MFRPVRFEDNLRHLAGLGPAGGDTFGPFRRAAVQQHHVRELRSSTIERIPDRFVIIVVDATAEGDLGPSRNENFRLGMAAGGKEVAAVDHCRGHVGVADLRAGARSPCRTALSFEQVGRIVAHELEGVAALQKRDAFGDAALKLDALHFATVLLALADALGILVVVELALDAFAGAVEQIDRRPQQVFDIGFQPRVTKHLGECIEDRGQRGLDDWLLGQRARIWPVLEGAMAINLHLVDEAVGRGG